MVSATMRRPSKKLRPTKSSACQSAFSVASNSGAMTEFRCSRGGSSKLGSRFPASSSPPDRFKHEPVMIELYFAPTPNGWKISVMLEECGLPYGVFPVNITRGEQLKPEFLKLSPNGRIPAIIDRDPPGGGEAISMFESGAILRYLAEKAGRFYPAGLRARHN